MLINIKEWLASKLDTDEITEINKLPVQSQLDKYDAAGTGIGFVLVLSETTAEVDSDIDEQEKPNSFLSLTSIPIVKINNQWVTVVDENISDIVSGVIRLMASRGA
jgi:protoheme ferro-lyase